MNPEEFLATADELCEGTREADWRSAVSRAYYAAFHAARNLLRECGFAVPRHGEAHAYLTDRLAHCGNPSLVLAARDLLVLRGQRNRADYDLDRPFHHADALDLVLRADGAARLFAQAAGEPTVRAAITTAMADHERIVLGVVTLRPAP